MENQHRKITGYRELSEAEIELMNEAKAIEAQFNGFIDRLKANGDCDPRDISLAQTEGEYAFMRAVRAIARPERKVA